jgi:molecular chaperone GrpE
VRRSRDGTFRDCEMTGPDDRSAGAPPADQNASTTEDAFAPGGDPRTTDEATAEQSAATESDAGGGESSDLQRELETQRDRYLRLAAEYDNYRRRTMRERQEAGARAQADLVKSLLDTLDDLERFAQVDVATATTASVVEGVGLVGRKLAKALAAAGLEVVNPTDQPFDPALHEALTTAPAASPEQDDTVGQVYQVGYVFGGQLLRPARVVVRQWNG